MRVTASFEGGQRKSRGIGEGGRVCLREGDYAPDMSIVDVEGQADDGQQDAQTGQNRNRNEELLGEVSESDNNFCVISRLGTPCRKRGRRVLLRSHSLCPNVGSKKALLLVFLTHEEQEIFMPSFSLLLGVSKPLTIAFPSPLHNRQLVR